MAGMNKTTKNLIKADKKCVWHPFTQMAGWVDSEPVMIDSADGFYLIDTEGNRYIDGFSSLWCNVHGHRVKRIDDAIRAQLDKVAHSTLLGLAQTRSIELAERLVDITPAGLDKVFYSDSGATSVEVAIKMAYQYWNNIGQSGRNKFIALGDAYHGDTVGSVSVGGIGLFHRIFKSLLFDVMFVDSPHPYRFDGSAEQCCEHSLEQMEGLLKDSGGEVAAIIVEPLIQGAAGIIVHPEGFLKGVSQLAKKYGVLLIVDEVATGFGRTGKMFACEHENVEPDFLCMAKGITGGYLPLAVTMTTQKVYDAFLGELSEHKTFYHGHTYTGNALACAAAIASLDLFEENKIIESLPEKIALIDRYFSEIAELPYVGDVRHKGLMCGIEIVKDKDSKESFDYAKTIGAKLCRKMWDKGVMIRPLSDVIVVMPAVGIGLELLEELLSVVRDTIQEIEI
jgi:adenosylmethionine-8-amino-7-oxononanoate aminotransferase